MKSNREVREMSKYEQKIKEIKDLQEEYDHDRRSEIEAEAFALMAEGKFEEAKELLDTLDDEIKKKIQD